jgi:tetratricopeptide (TPR) repeat protein
MLSLVAVLPAAPAPSKSALTDEAGLPALPDPLSTGKQALKEKRYPDAVQSFRLHTIQHPEDWRGYQYLGNALWGQGRQDDALVAYRQSLRLNPANTPLQRFVDAASPEAAGLPERAGRSADADRYDTDPGRARGDLEDVQDDIRRQRLKLQALKRLSRELDDPYRATHIGLRFWVAEGLSLSPTNASTPHLSAKARAGEGLWGGAELVGGRTNIAGSNQGFELGFMLLYLPVNIDYTYIDTYTSYSYYYPYTSYTSYSTYSGRISYDLGALLNVYYLNRFHRYWRAMAGFGGGYTSYGYYSSGGGYYGGGLGSLKGAPLLHACAAIEFVAARHFNLNLGLDYFSTSYTLTSYDYPNESITVPVSVVAPKLEIDLRF